MKFLLVICVVVSYLIGDSTTYNLNEYINFRTHQTQNEVSYSTRVLLYKSHSTKTVAIFRQEYDPFSREVEKQSFSLIWLYYFNSGVQNAR